MSLISTYQSCKTLLANKLNSKGVTASASSGLTTLINKVEDIQYFKNGVLLWSNKSIIQTNESADINVLVLDNGNVVTNEEVYFYVKEEQ